MNPPPQQKKLLHQMQEKMRLKHFSLRTEKAYLDWARRYILFHHKRHPKDMGPPEIEAFLTHLAADGQVSASTHTVPVPFRENQALSALLFLYREVLKMEFDQRI